MPHTVSPETILRPAPPTITESEPPSCLDLLSAMGGHRVGDPICQDAAQLASLHQLLITDRDCPARLGHRRHELIDDIDHRLTCYQPHPIDTDIPDRSPGVVVDGLAAAYVRASMLLRLAAAHNSRHSWRDEHLHTAWHTTAELADTWTELLTHLHHAPADTTSPEGPSR